MTVEVTMTLHNGITSVTVEVTITLQNGITCVSENKRLHPYAECTASVRIKGAGSTQLNSRESHRVHISGERCDGSVYIIFFFKNPVK